MTHSLSEIARELCSSLTTGEQYFIAFMIAENIGYHLVKDTQEEHGRRVEARQKDNPYATGQ